MATRNPILLRPHWILNNQLTLPVLVVDETTGKATIRGVVQLFVPLTIFLDTLFNSTNGYYTSRGFNGEQFHIYKSLEGILQATGVDGKACLLRTICEMQANPIGEFTVVGEILTLILTPQRGLNDFLHDYLEAEQIGQTGNTTCGAAFPSCPVSLYNLFGAEQGSDVNLEEEMEEDGGHLMKLLHKDDHQNSQPNYSDQVVNGIRDLEKENEHLDDSVNRNSI